MKNGFVGYSFVIAGDGRDEETEGAEPGVFELMDFLFQPRCFGSAKQQGEELDAGGRWRLLHFDQFERNRRVVILAHGELRMKLRIESLALEV